MFVLVNHQGTHSSVRIPVLDSADEPMASEPVRHHLCLGCHVTFREIKQTQLAEKAKTKWREGR